MPIGAANEPGSDARQPILGGRPVVALTALAFASVLFATTPPTAPVPEPLLRSLGLRGGQRGEVIIEQATEKATVPAAGAAIGTPLQVNVQIGGSTKTLLLRPLSLRSPSCILEVVGIDGARRQEPLPPSTLWSGQAEGIAGSSVVASIAADDARFAAIGRDASGTWSISHLPGAIEHPVSKKVSDDGKAPASGVGTLPAIHALPSDSMVASVRCGTTAAEVAVAPPAQAPAEPPPRCPRRWTVAMELDSAAVERFGGRRDAAIAWAELLLAAAADELRRTTAVEVILERITCLDAATAAEPVAAGALYAELWSRWSSRPDAERPTSVLHLTGRSLSDGAFGLSWIGGVAGGPAQRCAVIAVDEPRSLLGRAATVLHLMAHLLGADHCGDACGLMSTAWNGAPPPLLDARAAMQALALVHQALPAEPLAAPTEFSASDGTRCEGIELGWTTVPGATGYEILRGPDGEGAALQPVATAPTPPWIDTTAPPATRLRYQVRAVDACRRSEPSAADVGFAPGPVSAPTQIAASDGVGCADTTITWADVAHAKAYEVLRNSVNNPATATAIGRSEQARFVDSSPPAGVVWYWVRALDGCGRPGPLSRGDSGFVGGLPPAPTGIAATDGTACGTVILTWNAVAGATAYAIWRSTTPDLGQATQLAEVQASPFEDGAAPAAVELFYWIRAVSPCGKGPFGGPDRGRAAGSVPRISPIGDVIAPCGQPYQAPTPGLSNSECAVPVEWSIATGPPGLLIAADGTVQWPTPVAGTHVIIIAARNDSGVGQEQWTVQVQPVVPMLAGMPAASVRCGEALRVAAPAVTNATCAGPVQWSLDRPPAGASIAGDGTISWTPTMPGAATLTVMAANAGGSASTTCAIAVTPAPPQLEPLAAASAIAGSPWHGLAPTVANASCAGPLRWTLLRAPEGVAMGADGAPSWPNPVAGSFEIVCKATNDSGEAECTCRLTVVARPAPVITEIADVTATCGAAWSSAPPVVSNAEAAGTVTWSLLKGPEGAVIEASGVIRWSTPRPGTHEFLLGAKGDGGSDEEAFSLTIAPTAPPPINAVPDAKLDEGASYEVALSLPENSCTGSVTWLIGSGPEGLSIDDKGVVSWSAAAIGSHTVKAKARNAAGESEIEWRIDVAARE